MGKSVLTDCSEIPVTEIRKQLEYARIVCEELFNQFSFRNSGGFCCESRTHSIETKLSMLIDFISEASCWCNMLEMNQKIIEKLDKEEK